MRSKKEKSKYEAYVGCATSTSIAYIAIIVGVSAVLICGIFLYKRLNTVKKQLESCRSSCRSNI